MQKTVLFEIQVSTATVTINRPEKRNALNKQVVEELQQTFDAIAVDDRVRAVVLTGAGDVFCAGADLASLEAMQSASALENLVDSERLAHLFETIYLCPKPTIARVNGHALAGGCGLVTVCDHAVVSEQAKFGFTEVRLGFVPAIVGVFVLRKFGEAIARDLLLRGGVISASDAMAAGLVRQVVPKDKLDATVAGITKEYTEKTSASAVMLTKQLLSSVGGMGLTEALRYASQLNAFARSTDDCREGISAFLQRKDPPWARQE